MKRLIAGMLPLMVLGLVLVIQAGWKPVQLATAQSSTPVAAQTDPMSEEVYVSNLPDLGPAPAWMNENWLNTDKPLRLADLRGKVVLIDMWTFG